MPAYRPIILAVALCGCATVSQNMTIDIGADVAEGVYPSAGVSYPVGPVYVSVITLSANGYLWAKYWSFIIYVSPARVSVSALWCLACIQHPPGLSQRPVAFHQRARTNLSPLHPPPVQGGGCVL